MGVIGRLKLMNNEELIEMYLKELIVLDFSKSIMLALKAIFSKVDNIPILIFDEIDVGVGGETVRKIAQKLKEIGKNAQVICITHSPQIAAKAEQQFFIEKKVFEDTTVTSVKELSEKERIYEIGRMLAGENLTDTVLNHAHELLKED